jgi:hypothetical protein
MATITFDSTRKHSLCFGRKDGVCFLQDGSAFNADGEYVGELDANQVLKVSKQKRPAPPKVDGPVLKDPDPVVLGDGVKGSSGFEIVGEAEGDA